jgi:hypothetical protein
MSQKHRMFLQLRDFAREDGRNLARKPAPLYSATNKNLVASLRYLGWNSSSVRRNSKFDSKILEIHLGTVTADRWTKRASVNGWTSGMTMCFSKEGKRERASEGERERERERKGARDGDPI